MSFIEMQADLSKTNKLLERIARAMEVEIREKYHITIGHCAEAAPDPSPGENPTVTYASDEETVKLELERTARGLRQRLEEDVELENDDWTRA